MTRLYSEENKKLEDLSREELIARIKYLKKTMVNFETLIDATLYLNSILDIDELLKKLTKKVSLIMESETASICLLDELTQELKFRTVLDEKGQKLFTASIKIGEGIAGRVVEIAKPIIVNDTSKSPYFNKKFDELTGFQTKSILAVPLKVKEKIIGVMEALNKNNGNEFDSEDLEKCLVLANLAAIAIENARLFKEAEEAGNLREMNRFKSDLISFVAHEFKSPITLIDILGKEMLSQDSLDTKNTEILKHIEAENQRLNRLINSFLNLSQIEHGKISLKKEPVNLNETIGYCVGSLQEVTKKHNIKLIAPKDISPALGDEDKIMEIITNLISNAIKFSPDGGDITVEAREKEKELIVSVTDSGIGIAPDEIKKIFEHFYRGKESRGRKIEGSGLGLAIVKMLVEKMGGGIYVETKEGRGSTFSFTLPKAV